MNTKTVEEVQSWLTQNGFEAYSLTFKENQIDGEVLECLTERALESLIPIVGVRMKFLKLLSTEKKRPVIEETIAIETDKSPVPTNAETQQNVCETPVTPAGGESSMNNPRSKKKSHSLASKRRQRLARNKRKREERKMFKRGLLSVIDDLKNANQSLHKTIDVEKRTKEKYFEMWRASEKEKEKVKTGKLVFYGYKPKHQNLSDNKGQTEILHIDHSLLSNIKCMEGELGKGAFGSVTLRNFRSSVVAVKYFGPNTSSREVQKEAQFLKRCCHINLPIIFGKNNTQTPYFIATEFYGSENFQGLTLRSLLKESDVSKCTLGPEHWLHVCTQLADSISYLHDKQILHNDIKNDNVMVTCNSNQVFPVLIDFGKACFVNEGKVKKLTQEEKEKYYKQHFHIAPEVIEGTHPQSDKSDVYSLGVMIASIYRHSKYKPLKELARQSLKPFPNRKRLDYSPVTSTNVMNAKLPWPATIALPTDFRQEVTKILKEKDGNKVNKKFRRAFISRLFDHFSRYTLYPTKYQLTEVSQLIVKTYPFLKDRSIGTGYDSWHASLYEKFRNERKSIEDDPEVIQHKRRKTDEKTTSTISANLKRGAINWEPPYPEGEDEVSLKRHKIFLQSESSKRKPDWEKISNRMEITFPERRRFMNVSPAMVDIRREYPTLFNFDQMIAEFERILGLKQSVVATFTANFHQVAEVILTVAKESKTAKRVEAVTKMLALLDRENDDDDDAEATLDEKAEVAMAVLPYLVQPKPGSVCQSDFIQFIPEGSDPEEWAQARQSPGPCILMEGTLNSPGDVHLCGEKQVLATTNCTLLKATVGLMSVFYIFLCQYPPGLRNFYLYLQKCIMHIQDGRKLPSTVINFVNELDVRSSSL